VNDVSQDLLLKTVLAYVAQSCTYCSALGLNEQETPLPRRAQRVRRA